MNPKKLIFGLVLGIFLMSFVSADVSYYDPTSDVATVWDTGTGITFAEIDEGNRQPAAGGTGDNVADNIQGGTGVSEFKFDTITEVPN